MNARHWVLAIVFPCIVNAQAPTPPPHIERMAEVGRLWARLRWVHPALVEGDIDWDRQLVEVLPAIAKAESPQAQKEILERWLASLKDPALRVGPHVDPVYVTPNPAATKIASLPGNGVLVSLHDPIPAFSLGFGKEVDTIRKAFVGATRVVMDLRPSKDSADIDTNDYLKALVPGLIARSLESPACRYLYDLGWPSQTYDMGTYYTAWMAQHVEPCRPEPGAHPMPMAFIVDSWTKVPKQVLALQRAGLAYIVSVGDSPNIWMPVETRPFGTSFEVTYRVGEWLFPDGTTGYGADQVIPADTATGADSQAVSSALVLLDSKKVPGAKIQRQALPLLPVRQPDQPYREMTFPTLPWRQLAVIRFWSVIDAFFPYKDLMDRPWSGALPEFLLEMERVKDGMGYAQILARMAARLQDNHVGLKGHPFFDILRGEAGLPVTFRMVENSVLVDQVLDPKSAEGIHRWDEVLEIDGEPVTAWMARIEPYVVSANAWTRDRNLVIFLGRGQDSTEVRLKVRVADGSSRDCQLRRMKQFPRAFPKTLHTGETVQILASGIGYVDLGRLMPTEVDSMFDRIKDTKALIMDMRGYPNMTAWDIAPRLNVLKGSNVAMYFPNTISGADGSETDGGTVAKLERMPEAHGKPLYTGKVVMLINEVTQSQAEHTGLLFEAACGITFVGSPSAGSNGDVTDLRLPGGIVASFTGQGVKHADGRQLQRVGLQPQIFVRPTVKGVREGRDEVMERAIHYLQQGN